MKIFKSLLMAMAAIALSACSSVDRKESFGEETIFALAADQTSLYMMGEKYDYQFPLESTQNILKIVKSPYIKHMVLTTSPGKIYNQKEAMGEITLLISPAKLTKKQQADLRDNYKFVLYEDVSPRSFYGQIAASNRKLNQSPHLLQYTQHFDKKKIVKIQNRQDFIQQYPLSRPINISIDYYKRSSSLNNTNTAIAIGIPILFIAAAPLYLICETGNGC